MARELKNILEAAIKDRVGDVDSCVLIDYQGLDSEKTQDLRASLRQQGVRMSVLQNRLARRVFTDSGAPEDFRALLRGPTALVYSEDDGAVSASKYVVEWGKKNPDLATVKGGLFQGKALDAADVQKLAALPDLPTMQSTILSMFLGPLTYMVSAASSMVSHFASCTEARQKDLEAGDS